ncbi:hypothetical protein LTR84_005163 [Exophiala bonariae]|uniref:Calponin-homology (CH) domain-containing protein n=1 Tax=Exophiala bonariae TaxID=1690606 RepID=A0AAV9NSY0_9EURO|nr:hypothetical protein LTR84_005163 [Exophiala bonariae]
MGTPCPVPASAGVSRRPWRESLFNDLPGGDDTTTNIEFTSAFGRPKPQVPAKASLQSSLMGGKPRRTNVGRKGGNGGLGFTIYDDDDDNVDNAVRSVGTRLAPANTLTVPAKRGVMAQPPQRPKHRVSFMQPPPPSSSEVEVAGPLLVREDVSNLRSVQRQSQSRRISQVPPRRPAMRDDSARNETQKQPYLQQPCLAPLPEDMDLTMPAMDSTMTILKPARRGTIYIPNEDTTMPSMYMGIFSPIKDLDTRAIVEAANVPDSELTGIAAQMAKKRAPARRQSVIAASPKRMGGPLQTVSRPVQESAVVQDRLGQGAGKENVPPGQSRMGRLVEMEKKKESMKPAKRISGVVQKNLSVEHRSLADSMASLSLNLEPVRHSSRLFAPTTSSLSKAAERPIHNSNVGVKTSWNAGLKARTAQDAAPTTKKSPPPKPKVPELRQEQVVVSKKASVPSRFVVPTAMIKNESVLPLPAPQTYPVLTENLVTPSMYEDNWLQHQEIAMTQLVNSLFDTSDPPADHEQAGADGGMLRVRLLEMYGNAESALLFKRLQAALMYGAFRAPVEGSAGAAKLSCDVGKRKAFTDLWLTTYELGCLTAALEAVVGRRCGGASRFASPRAAAARSRKEGSGASTCDEEPRMNRVRQSLRRFIEIFLIRNEDGELDEATSSSSTAHASWSYQRTMLRSLMLIKLLDAAPIGGCLFQLSSSYKSSLSLIQALFQMLNPSAGDPTRALGHVGYSVYRVQHPLEEYNYRIQNLAVDLRDGVRLTRLVEVLLLSGDDSPLEEAEQQQNRPGRPLSQQLKFPCLGRATKIHNVQVALDALYNIQGMAALTHDIAADDIVDGFREKTVRLLWGLTNKWGLGGLLDWEDVEREIKRIGRSNSGMDCGGQVYFTNALVGEEDGCSRYRTLLVSWAQVIARKREISVSNMTTSFADGLVFESIVDEYQEHIIGNHRRTDCKHLSERLRGLGCSDQFAGLFSPSSSSSNRTHIFDQDFVMAALAFLCSRLLGPSRSSRVAVTIQRAWRTRWGRVLQGRKSQLKMMAEGCASLVRANRRQVLDGDECQSEDLPIGNTLNTAPQGKDGEAAAKTETAYDTDRTITIEVSMSVDEKVDEPEGDIWLSL